ncbi:X-ray repair cross-complementing protein 6 [Mortierella claussenii]|nr:X-ray repair cross-complementing protein 6 [Mortierella claussenii]
MSSSSSWRSRYDDNEEEEDGDETILTDAQETQWSSRDSILFVIDCSPAMLKPAEEDGEIPFYTAIKCAMTVQLNKIISSESDLVGIVLYGTEKSKNPNNFEHIYVLQDLETPDVNKIQQLETIDDKMVNFDEEFGTSNGSYTLGEVFWTASSLFSSNAQRVGSKRMFLFTNEDDPHSEDISLRSASKVRAKDLQQFGLKIELFDIDKPGEKFNRKNFYKDILIEGVDDDDAAPTEDTSSKLSELLQRVQRKEVKKRALFNIPLKLAPGLEIGVKGYNLVMAQTKGPHRNVYTLGEAVREVTTVTSWLCADTTQPLMPAFMKYYWEFGGTKVVFTKDEVASMKTFGPPGLALIGFKPKNVMHMHLNISHAMFLYPDERSYEGSTRAFSSLLKAMAEMNKVAICSFTQRKNYSTRLVALVPQLEVVSENGQEQPPGFQLIPLPWADDIRPLPIQTDYTPPTELIDAAKAVISKLNMKKGFQPDNYENPSLQKHYKVLQATALNQRDMDIDDKTLPKTEQMHVRAGAYIQNFKDVADTVELPEPTISPSLASAATKRSTQSQDSSASKRARSSQAADGAGLLQNMQSKYDNGELNKATVATLKEFLSSVNLKPEGTKKAELISQVEKYFEN